jgi:1A family penicillin-binding protein
MARKAAGLALWGLLALPLRLIRLILGAVFFLVWRMALRLAVLGGLLVALVVGFYVATLPPIETLLDGRARGSVTLFDLNGEVFAWRGDQFGGFVRASGVSPHLVNAVVATEDKRFYRHFGISPRGIAGAIRTNLREGRGPFQGSGGSTITQQVAKLLCLGKPYDPAQGTEADYEASCRAGSIVRKLKEVPFALAMELKYSKDEILTIYLNRAYLGAGAYGFEAAAQRYFGKSAREVNISEAAMLAGLLTAPSTYSPVSNIEASRDRAGIVIGLMEDQGYITPSEASAALAAPATLSRAAQTRAGGYFADWIMSSGPAFLTRQTSEDVLIETTFDPRIQRAAEEALKVVFETKVKEGSKAEAAIIVMSPDGAVRAIVGGRDVSGVGAFNRATQALRQTGSSFKPFVYAAALEAGFTPDLLVEDAPVTVDVPGSGPWSPENYDRGYQGVMTMTDALARSINTVAVRLSEEVGSDRVRAVARDFGIESPLAPGPAVALGASEATLMEMTGAYAGFLNGGRLSRPYGFLDLRLADDNELLMEADRAEGYQVLGPEASGYLVYMLRQVVLQGTGTRAALPDREVAGKTGTTQAARDAWFIGFSADYVTGVWMGYDDNSPLSGVTGGGLPAEIWRETMLRVHEGLPPRPLPMLEPPASAPFSPLPDLRGEAEPPPAGGDNLAEQVLNDILRGILGN